MSNESGELKMENGKSFRAIDAILYPPCSILAKRQ